MHAHELHPLDTVRDSAQLAGAFPTSVAFDSLLYWHGDPEDMSLVEIQDNARRLGAGCQNADYIGIEVCHARSQESLLQDFETINTIIQSGVIRDIRDCEMIDETSDEDFDVASSWALAVALGITAGLRGTGKPLPRFFAIDAWESPQLSDKVADMLDALDYRRPGFIEDLAAVNREREALVIAQLHRLAMLIDTGRPQRIALVQGLYHNLTAPALRALGADVARTYIDRVPASPITQCEHILRFGGSPAVGYDHLQFHEAAAVMGDHIYERNANILPGTDDPVARATAYAELSTLCLQGIYGTLPDAAQQTLEMVCNSQKINDTAMLSQLLREASVTGVRLSDAAA